MSASFKIKGYSKGFLIDWKVIDGLFKTDKRGSRKSNLRNFRIQIVKAESKEKMGVKFHKLPDACCVHFDIPSGRDFQLLVHKSLDMKEVKKREDLNDAYKELIENAHRLANGLEPKKKGFLDKIKDAIF